MFQILHDGQKIQVLFQKCKIVREVYGPYVRLDLSNATGNREDLLLIHRFIKGKTETPTFSPLKYAAEDDSWVDIVTKISNAKWQNRNGVPIEPKWLTVGDEVDVIFTVSAYGDFGFFLTIQDIQTLT
jgi:hypothetical protein